MPPLEIGPKSITNHMAFFSSPEHVNNKRFRDYMERMESDPTWRSPETPKLMRLDDFMFSCGTDPIALTASRYSINAMGSLTQQPVCPASPPRMDMTERTAFTMPPLSPSNRNPLQSAITKQRRSLKLSSPKQHRCLQIVQGTVRAPYTSPKRTPHHPTPKPSPRRIALNTLDHEVENLADDTLNDLLSSDDVREWVKDNIAGVTEKGKISRLARVQMDATRNGRDSNLKWVYDANDQMIGATCDGVWFSSAEIKSYV